MDDVASLDRAQQFVDKNYRVPGVAANIDPKKSFWKGFRDLSYPSNTRPQKTAVGRPGRSATWMSCRHRQRSEVLSSSIGKGAFGGPYGTSCSTRYAAFAGDPTRSARTTACPGRQYSTESRRAPCRHAAEVVYDLVVNQLRCQEAAYLGHSLGGQLVIGTLDMA